MRSPAAVRAPSMILALGLLIFPGTWCLADPLFTVTDLGTNVPAPPSTGYFDIQQQPWLTIDGAGHVTTGSFPQPIANYPGLLPDELKQGPYAGNAVAVARSGNNVAGWGFNQNLYWTAFAVIDGKPIVIPPLPGSSFNQAFGINAAGQVVGLGGFLYTPDQGMHLISTPGIGNAATAINDAGLITGQFATFPHGQPSLHAFLSDNGSPAVDLNHLIAPNSGWTLLSAMGINNSGQIAALGEDATGQVHVLRLSPSPGVDLAQIRAALHDPANQDPSTVPEPSTLTIFGMAGVALAVRRYLRRQS